MDPVNLAKIGDKGLTSPMCSLSFLVSPKKRPTVWFRPFFCWGRIFKNAYLIPFTSKMARIKN